MGEDGMVNAYLLEADRHIRDAEAVLRELGSAGSTHMRRMRAAMYVRAMRRLRGLIAANRSLPWNQAVHAAASSVRTDPARAIHWSMRWRRQPLVDATEHECRDR